MTDEQKTPQVPEMQVPEKWRELYEQARWNSVACCNGSTYNIRLVELIEDLGAALASEAAKDEQIGRLEEEKQKLSNYMDRVAGIEEKAHLQTIDERDAAEEALSQAYFLIKGESPHWSNMFGHKEALEDIDDAQRCLRSEIASLEQLLQDAEQDRERMRQALNPKHQRLIDHYYVSGTDARGCNYPIGLTICGYPEDQHPAALAPGKEQS